MHTDSSPSAPEGTRLALIEAGLRLFGSQGFAATSTRELAAAAATNIGSIAYHFGGKEGLRLACAAEFARRIGTVAAVPVPNGLTPEAARALMRAILGRIVGFFVAGAQAEHLVAFMLRELAENGPGVDVLYDRLVEPNHRRFCALWAAATGAEAESEAVRLAVFSMLGQVVYFRIGRSVVARRMGWAEIGPAEAERITDTLLVNFDALLGAHRES